jgi:hypothetical protein
VGVSRMTRLNVALIYEGCPFCSMNHAWQG